MTKGCKDLRIADDSGEKAQIIRWERRPIGGSKDTARAAAVEPAPGDDRL
jgi:hypothetical protein